MSILRLLALTVTIIVLDVPSAWSYCPHVKIMRDVDWSDIMGRWYGIGWESKNLCRVSDYKLTGDNTFTKNGEWGINLETHFKGNGRVLRPGVFKLHLKAPYYSINADIAVLHTDYDNYIVLYGCISGVPRVYIETRSKKPTDSVWSNIKKILSQNDLSSSFLASKENEC